MDEIDDYGDNGTIHSLLNAVRSGRRVKLSRGNDRIAMILPHAEYERLLEASGEALAARADFGSTYRQWRTGVEEKHLLHPVGFLESVRDES
jgi:antitoxin (DNA-binding transcriptional repressor) of toxin-antitoxin stability system